MNGSSEEVSPLACKEYILLLRMMEREGERKCFKGQLESPQSQFGLETPALTPTNHCYHIKVN